MKPSKVAIDGILLLDKPAGISSNGALGQVKRLFHPLKAGHGGSLDPFATGLLPICFGEATKFAQYLLEADKTYEARISLGYRSATGDPEGDIIEQRAVPELTRPDIERVLASLVGPQDQVPPMYSALKINGERLYRLAREGKNAERKPRPIVLHELELLDFSGREISYRVRCSKGTYIRVLSEDIAGALGTVGCTTALRRTAVTPFSSDAMLGLEALQDADVDQRQAHLLPMDAAIEPLPRLDLAAAEGRRLRQGQRIEHPGPDSDLLRAYDRGQLLGVVSRKAGIVKAIRLVRTN